MAVCFVGDVSDELVASVFLVVVIAYRKCVGYVFRPIHEQGRRDLDGWLYVH